MSPGPVLSDSITATDNCRVPTAPRVTQEAASAILKGDWQLLLPGDKTASGVTIPIRSGHYEKPFWRKNSVTRERELFDPKQMFFSPSVRPPSPPTYYSFNKIGFENTVHNNIVACLSDLALTKRLRNALQLRIISDNTDGDRIVFVSIIILI